MPKVERRHIEKALTLLSKTQLGSRLLSHEKVPYTITLTDGESASFGYDDRKPVIRLPKLIRRDDVFEPLLASTIFHEHIHSVQR